MSAWPEHMVPKPDQFESGVERLRRAITEIMKNSGDKPEA